jgi:hypothetical protein
MENEIETLKARNAELEAQLQAAPIPALVTVPKRSSRKVVNS